MRLQQRTHSLPNQQPQYNIHFVLTNDPFLKISSVVVGKVIHSYSTTLDGKYKIL